MTQVSVDKDLAIELVDMKLKFLNDEINKILSNWKYENTKKFLKDAEDGTLQEAEDDAITLVHLIDQREELFNLKKNWKD